MPRRPNKTDDSGGFPQGFGVFPSIHDPRNGGKARHHFGELRENWLHKWLKLPNGTPCHNTFSRVFQAIEPGAFAACIAGKIVEKAATTPSASKATKAACTTKSATHSPSRCASSIPATPRPAAPEFRPNQGQRP